MKKIKFLLLITAFTVTATTLQAQQKERVFNVKARLINNPKAIIISEADFKKKPLAEQNSLLLNPRVIVYKTAITETDIRGYEMRN